MVSKKTFYVTGQEKIVERKSLVKPSTGGWCDCSYSKLEK